LSFTLQCVFCRYSGDEDDELADWKPSVYWVMLILFAAATIIACCAAALFHVQEKWSYVDSLYYSFVSFSTVGFGDLVASHQTDYPHDLFYRASNWLITLVGCCCVYSLFNVTSLVIKLFLNFLIARLNVRCPGSTDSCLRHRRCLCSCCGCCRPQKTSASQVANHDGVSFSRRNAIVPGQRAGAKPRSTRTIHPLSVADLQRRQNGVAPDRGVDDSSPAAADSAPSSRRSSTEYVSIRDFLKVSKISMAMMQKQLYETAHRGASAGGSGPHAASTSSGGGRAQPHSATGGGGGSTGGSSSGLQGGVGPLAILNHKLCHDEL